VDKPNEDGKPQFFKKKGILYRRYFGKRGEDAIAQLVVPHKLRDKVISLAHETLLPAHKGAAKTLSRVQQEFYWPGVHEFVIRYVASCDFCQRNVSKKTVSKAPLGKLPLVETPFSVVVSTLSDLSVHHQKAFNISSRQLICAPDFQRRYHSKISVPVQWWRHC